MLILPRLGVCRESNILEKQICIKSTIGNMKCYMYAEICKYIVGLLCGVSDLPHWYEWSESKLSKKSAVTVTAVFNSKEDFS